MFSLVTSFYNFYDRFLDQWLDAVLSSSELPDEIIISISGTDYDPKNIERASERLSGKASFRFVYSEHLGMGHARNQAVKSASGDWIMHLNVDDMVTPNAISNIKAALSDDCDVIVGNMEWNGHSRFNGIKKYPLTLDDFMQGRTNDHATYRKSVWERSPYIEYSGDVDTAFWIGLAHLSVKIKHVDKVLTKHFFRPDTVFGRYSKEDKREIQRMISVWQKEGVHSDRFKAPEYKIKQDAGFSHVTRIADPDFSIIMAFRSDGGIRDKHLNWTVEHFRKMFPDAEIIIEEDNSDKGWDTFNKSKLLNQGVARSHGRVLFITDIDMIFIKNKILAAVEQIDRYSVVFPLDEILFMDELQTEAILKAKNTASFPRINLFKMPQEKLVRKKRKDRDPGGSYIITRENYDKIGGHDERFVGWGSEDSAFIKAATTMIDKPSLRIGSIAYHLYHPTDNDRFSKRDDSIKAKIMQEYFEALDNREQMHEIIQNHLRIRIGDDY